MEEDWRLLLLNLEQEACQNRCHQQPWNVAIDPLMLRGIVACTTKNAGLGQVPEIWRVSPPPLPVIQASVTEPVDRQRISAIGA